jgi:hypothetical protein
MTPVPDWPSRPLTRWRVARWVGFLAGIPALCACSSDPLVVPMPHVEAMGGHIFRLPINRKFDILFEVDNSVSMAPEQANLAANFPSFIKILENLPGGLPDVHIGVITSDMGAGASSADVQGCERPDNGGFIDKARAATDPVCATALLNAGEHFIASTNGGTQNNFAGDISDVFRCLAEVGTTGCGFEDHLESVRAALGDPVGAPAHDIPIRAVPTNNTGFLRPDAYLAVILITNEEECSSPPDSALFDPNASATLGPLSARCFSHTDICDGQRVINYVQAGNAVGPFNNCSADDTTFNADPKHGAIPVPFYVDYIKKLKASPDQVLTSGIIAPAAPYTLVSVPDGQGGTMLGQGASCIGAAGVFGQPTPRLTEFFGAFGPGNAITTSICDQSFAAAMTLIANRLDQLTASPCVANVLDVMGPNGSRPDCTVVDHTINAQGLPVDTPLASCVDNGNQAPCWSLVPGTGTQCPGQQIMQLMRPANQPQASTFDSTVECVLAP